MGSYAFNYALHSTSAPSVPPAARMVYRNNPYSVDSSRVEQEIPVFEAAAAAAAPPYYQHPSHYRQAVCPVAAPTPLPTAPMNLSYSSLAYLPAAPEAPQVPFDQLCRIFIGQLPFGMDEQGVSNFVFHLCGVFLYHPERIVKRNATCGKTLPTGCFHVYMTLEAAELLMQVAHHKCLVDASGAWLARDDSEQQSLYAFCSALREHRQTQSRSSHIPCRPVVVEFATSKYMPPNY